MSETTFRDRPPWSDIGQDVTATTAQEALKDAGLDWTVSLRPAGTKNNKGNWVKVPDRSYVVRDDTGEPLSEVSNRYVPLQNGQAFRMFDNIVDSGDIGYDQVGSLNGGRYTWLTAKVPDEMLINGVDPIGIYLLLRNSHDGSASVTVAVTPIRVWCQNTMNLALHKAINRWSVRHVSGAEGRVHDAREALGLTFKYMEEFEEVATSLLQTSMSDNQFARFMTQFTEEIELGERATATMIERTTSMFHDGENLDNVRGTKWAALNTIAEFYDWDRPKNEHARAMSSWNYPKYRNTALRMLS